MILVIDNYDSFTYNLVQAMRSLGVEVKVVRNDAIDVAGIAAMAPEGLVISPGPGNPDSAGVSLAAVKAFAGKIPILGICLGHQTIAQAFGGRIVRAKKPMHGKKSRIRHDGKGLFDGIDQGVEVMRYHSLVVERETLGEGLIVTAESEDGEIMGLRHEKHAIESLQYHPESIGTKDGVKQLANFVETVTRRHLPKALGEASRKALLQRALGGGMLNAEESEGFFASILSGGVGEVELAAFLTALAKNQVTAGELAGAARAMRDAALKIDLGGVDAVDIVGTGGDGAGTFNVSTTAAFIAAGAGVTIAKHGNVASTSKCGSADVLRELGINLEAPIDAMRRSVLENGIGFLFCKALHPAMRFAANVRRTLGFRTLFNLLGPLTNPAGVKRQVIGVPAEKLAPVIAEALKMLGSVRSLVVSGAGGIDEISPDAFTFVSSLQNGAVRNMLIDAAREYGERHTIADIAGGDAAANAKILLGVLEGRERGAYRAASIENAAAAILVAGKAADYKEALLLAGEAVDSGRAFEKLNAMRETMK